jgi:anti-sigma-K factor RskA
VSSGLEHQECTEALGAYVLGALPEDEGARVQRHISECQDCRAQFEWLRVAADALPASVPPVQPPPELKSRVMEIVHAEADLLRAAGEAADRPPRTERPSRWSWLTGRALRPAGAVAIGLAVLVLAVVLITSGGSGSRTVVAQSTRPGSASLLINGTRAQLVVHGFQAPPAGHVDELWVKHGDSAPRPAGTFVLRSGTVALGRPVHAGDTVLVTVEPGRGTRAPTTTPFLVARA